MSFLPDVKTLGLCSVLASSAFGFVFLVLWLRNRQAAYYATWAASSLLYGLTLICFAVTPREAEVPITILFGMLGVINALPLAGVFWLERRAVRPWLFASAAAAPLGHTVPLGLAAAGLIEHHETWQTFGDAIGLAISLAVPGIMLAFGPGAKASLGRRITGCAMFGYLPAYVLPMIGEFHMLPGRDLVAMSALLSDQLLLGMFNLGLLSIPVEQVQKQLRDAALRDPLTGCWNRAGQAKLAHVYFKPDAAVIALDVDYFKQINDRHGHAAGDEVLAYIGEEAARLAQVFGGEVSRIGGDEFVILLPAAGRDPTHFTALLQNRLGTRSMLGSGWSVSLGLARVRRSDSSLDDSIARADAALYRAKAVRCAPPDTARASPGFLRSVQNLAAASSASR